MMLAIPLRKAWKVQTFGRLHNAQRAYPVFSVALHPICLTKFLVGGALHMPRATSATLSLLLVVCVCATAQNVAKVQFMITNRMKEELASLGYSAMDIATLEPSRAAAIIDRSIRRPSQGMPKSWSRGGAAAPKGMLGKVFGIVKQAATVALATSLALHFTGTNLGMFSDIVDEAVYVLRSTLKTHR